MAKPKLFLIDAHALCYRAFFAIQNLRTSYGQPTNAVFGFINTLKKILKDFKPDYMAACFDVGKKTHRQEKFAEYKVHRPSMPDDLISQIPLIKELILAYNIPVFELEGFEADDVIATISKGISPKDAEVIIVSGDKDMLQLIEGNIKMFDYRREEIVDAKGVKDRYGFEPKHIVDFIGLAGDKTDNIPGVDGVGKVTATNLIQEYGSLEQILKNVDKIKSQKLSEKLSNQKDQALMSKDLALLDMKVPIDFSLKDLKVTEPDTEKLRQFFSRMEFRRLAEGLGVPTAAQEVSLKLQKTSIETKKDAEDLVAAIEKKKYFALAFESSLEDDLAASQDLVVALDEKHIFVVPPSWIKNIKSVFESIAITKICHGSKALFKILNERDILVAGKVFDVMLAGYLLEASQSVKDLGILSFKYLNRSFSKEAGFDQKVSAMVGLFKIFKKELEEKTLLKLFEEIEIPLSYVLYRMEQEGVCLDIKFLKKLSTEANKEITILSKKIYKMAGEEFNLNSPKQLSHILFEKLKLPVVKKTKTGFSTNESVLHKLAPKHKLPALLLDYRQLTKLTTTYIDALPKLLDAKTKRIHANFDQAGTETGRLSSRNPNLQNIPIRTDLGRQIRKAFIPSDKNHIIVSADYSQIELRILAHLSQDKNLIKAFKNDEDIHQFTAGLIFDVKSDKVTREMRVAAKRVNFGIVYGMSAFGLAKDLGVPQSEAQEFIDKYFLRYPKVSEYMQKEIKKAEKDGFVITLLNRRRYIPEIHSDNMSIRQFAQRQAINTPVQGSAADLIKLAMIQVQEKIDIEDLKSRMTITVHDELVFDVLKSEKERMMVLIKKEMEGPLKLSVPIKVSVKAGQNWLDLSEVS
ncbi:MAG: DNA polymerase I [Candidatus Aceula meridiana]|nr:DNA polymerase I [Candidatus Aceula meridiana]